MLLRACHNAAAAPETIAVPIEPVDAAADAAFAARAKNSSWSAHSTSTVRLNYFHRERLLDFYRELAESGYSMAW